MLGYTNDVNPFGDSNLLQPFVWGKKKEKDKTEGKSDVNMHSGGKRLELIGEIEKVRKRRKDREDELEEVDRLREEEQRLREAAQYGDWMRKEEDFHLNQTRERSKIRLVEKREKPIDLIAKNILLIDAANADDMAANYDAKNTQLLLELEVELRNPVELVEELAEEEFAQLVTDVESYLALERRKADVDASSHTSQSYTLFWESLLFITIAQLRKVRKNKASSSSSSSAGSSGDSRLHSSVMTDIERLLEGKSFSELEDLQTDIEKSIQEVHTYTIHTYIPTYLHTYTPTHLHTYIPYPSRSPYPSTLSILSSVPYHTHQGKSANSEYWEVMQQEVKVQIARAYVNDTHITLLQKQLELLSQLRVEAREKRLQEALLNPKGLSAAGEREVSRVE